MLSGCKILIIDDSEDDRFLYRRLITTGTKGPVPLTESPDGESGLALVEEGTFDCVLLDYSLPGRDGLEILKRIHAIAPYLAVVMLTGQGNEKIAVSAIQEGAQNYISKATITPESLKRVIWMAIERSRMEKRIAEQNQSLELFTHALAHDLKEPARTIRSFLEILETKKLTKEKAAEYSRYIRLAADKMAALIDSVYIFLQAKSEPNKIKPSPIEAGEALEAARNNLNKLITESGAVVTNDPLPRAVVRQDQLVRLFQNLISNAIQHRDKPPRIHITGMEQDGFCVFKVRDNGPGIAAIYIEKIFEPFKKLSYGAQNLGLGLAICRQIVETNGGKIWCDSKLGEGSAFYFSLPLGSTESVRSGEPITHRRGEREEREQARILLVEDSLADAELVRYELFENQALHCSFDTAQSGETALNLLRKREEEGHPVDLILMDINMPGMDGFETIAQLHKDQALAKIPVIMCTTSSYKGDVEKAGEVGAAGYLLKPLSYEGLKAAIEPLSNLNLIEREEGGFLYRADVA